MNPIIIVENSFTFRITLEVKTELGTLNSYIIVCKDSDKQYTIELLYVPVKIRRRGYAHQLMKACVEEADRKRKKLRLTVDPQSGPDPQTLTAFYRSYGFKLQDDLRTMIREAV